MKCIFAEYHGIHHACSCYRHVHLSWSGKCGDMPNRSDTEGPKVNLRHFFESSCDVSIPGIGAWDLQNLLKNVLL